MLSRSSSGILVIDTGDVAPDIAEQFVPDVAGNKHVHIPTISCEGEKELTEEVDGKDVQGVAGCQTANQTVLYHSIEHVAHNGEQDETVKVPIGHTKVLTDDLAL